MFLCILLEATFWTPTSCGRANPQGDTGPKSRLRLRGWIHNLGASIGPRMRIAGFGLLHSDRILHRQFANSVAQSPDFDESYRNGGRGVKFKVQLLNPLQPNGYFHMPQV